MTLLKSQLALLTSLLQPEKTQVRQAVSRRVRCWEAVSAMAEVGLLVFARTALDVGRAVLPPYRTRFSKHQFTQPQLLAILCLMRYAEWGQKCGGRSRESSTGDGP